MKCRAQNLVIAAILLATVSMTIQLSAQNGASVSQSPSRYKLIDLGTLGGYQSVLSPAYGSANILTHRGAVIGSAETTLPDPFPQFCFSFYCLTMHAFEWKNGSITDLGALPGNNNSVPFGVNEEGTAVGISENSTVDTTTGFPAYEAVVFHHGNVINLGTFGGADSFAYAVNNWGQVAGWALNDVPDSYAAQVGAFCVTLYCLPVTTQIRAFVWQGGKKLDLGTLGGNDAAATLINDFGMVAGVSYTDTTPDPTTHIPTQHTFLWIGGKMIDVGGLGIANISILNSMNRWGQVVGISPPADYWFHGFLWDGVKLQDLGTPLGGSWSVANFIGDDGVVVGQASLPGDKEFHAVTWDHGKVTDLGSLTSGGCSFGYWINARKQVIGDSTDCAGNGTGTFLWQNGTMYDLSTLIPPTDLFLGQVWQINDDGVIAGNAWDPNDNEHAFILVPCGDDDEAGCQNQVLNRPAVANLSTSSTRRTRRVDEPPGRFQLPAPRLAPQQ